MSLSSRSSLILTSTTLVLGLGFGLAPAASAVEPVTEPTNGAASVSFFASAPDAYTAQVLTVINQERAKVGSPALRWNPGVAPVAKAWSNHLTEATKSSAFQWSTIHRSDAGGSLIPKGASWYSEIIAFNTTPERIVAWWMSSPAHKDAMLDPRVTDIGIGYNIPDSGPYAGQHMVVANMAQYNGGPFLGLPVEVDVTFSDVSESPFFNEIAWMQATGIATGYSDGTFKPTEAVKRDEMALFMYRMAGSPEYTAPEVSPFADVPTDHPAYKEIAWLHEAGISAGSTDHNYLPEEDLSRESMSVFLKNFAGTYRGVQPAKDFAASSQAFTDSTTSPFSNNIEWMKSAGVSTGFADGTYRPYENVSREGMAAFLYRLDGYITTNTL